MPRLSIVLTNEQLKRMDKHLPWGTKQPIMVAVIEQLCETLEEHGPKLLGLILSKEFNLITKEVRRPE